MVESVDQETDAPAEPNAELRKALWIAIPVGVVLLFLVLALVVGGRQTAPDDGDDLESLTDDPSRPTRFMRPGQRPKEPALTSEKIAATGNEEAAVLDMAKRKLVELAGAHPEPWASATYDSEGRWIVNGSTKGRGGAGVLWTVRIRVDLVQGQRVLNVTECVVDGVSHGK